MESKGLGDSIEKFTKATGIKKAVDVLTELVGIEDCGCEGRKEKLNNFISYKVGDPEPTPPTEPFEEGDSFLVLSNVSTLIGNKESRMIKGDILIASEDNKIYIEGYLMAGLLKKL